jgi:hypothetical protein
VRKQTTPTTVPTPRLAMQNPSGIAMSLRGTQFTIRPQSANVTTTTARMIRPQPATIIRSRGPRPQQRFSFADGRVVPGNTSATALPSTGATSASTIFTQQNGSISVARAPQPDTPFGKAKTAFEDKIINGLEICQHTINKMIILTNSTSFKTSRTFSDLKDLYIHLQYLFTYTSGKFKTLQDNLVQGMEDLAKLDTSSKEKNEDDELEIVEQKTDIIEVLSDDENDNPEADKSIGQHKNLAMPKIDVEQEIASSLVETIQQAPLIQIPNQLELLANLNIEVDDNRLKERTVVKVERLEDSKNSVIKQYMIALQQRQNAYESRDSSPDIQLEPEVTIEENENCINNENASNNVPQVNVLDKIEKTTNIPDVVEIPSDEEECSSSKTNKMSMNENEKNKQISNENNELTFEDKVKKDGNEKIDLENTAFENDNDRDTDMILNDDNDNDNEVVNIDETPPIHLMEEFDKEKSLEVEEMSNKNKEKSNPPNCVDQPEIISVSSSEELKCVSSTNITINSSTSENEFISDEVTENGLKYAEKLLENNEPITTENGAKITEQNIDEDKDLLDNIISSLEESESIAICGAPMQMEISENSN